MKRNYVAALPLLLLLNPGCALFASDPTPTAEPVVADFGDAPDPDFPSLLASDGARALDPSQVWLGLAANTEGDAQTVDRDTFDDGLVAILVADQVRVTFEATRSEDAPAGIAYFNLLADLNGDGRWESFEGPSGPASEWIVMNQSVQLDPGARRRVEAKFVLAEGNLEAWMRATLTDVPIEESNWRGTGEFERGEVEDHIVGRTDVWDIACDPDPLVIDHGGADAINLVVRGAPPPTSMEVVAVTGTPGLLDPNGDQISVNPDPSAGEVRFGPINVSSLPEAVHGTPGMVQGVAYGIEVKVTGPVGVKSVNCEVIVNHFAPAGLPPAVQAADGSQISYLGPLQGRSGGDLMSLFQVTDSAGQPASGELSATLGDPPTDPKASHARGDLDSEGFVTLPLEILWGAGTTKLFTAFRGSVYEVATITILD